MGLADEERVDSDQDSLAPLVERRDNVADVGARRASKTPMFEAIHAARYQRQTMIRQIQDEVGTRLICFICGPRGSIDRDDTVFFMDLLHHAQRGEPLDFMLHTGGGDIDAAEKLITIVRTWVDRARLRVIVPDFAKSAGTLMAVGADAIVMSDTSELGPIDPQFSVPDANGNLVPHSVQNYLDAYEEHAARLREDPSDAVAAIMLRKLDPGTLKLLEAYRARSRKFAEAQLMYGMFRSPTAVSNSQNGGNYTSTADALINTKRWLTHGQMIDVEAAKAIGLVVEYVPPDSQTWLSYWRLYCLQRLSLNDGGKLFESEQVSLPIG